MAAYLTGRWQGGLALAIQPEPRVRNAANMALAARAAARAKAEDLYQKLVDGSTPAAKNNGIDLAKDLKGGLAKLAAMAAGKQAQQAYKAAFAAWAKDPAHAPEAAAVAEGLPASLERTAAMRGVADGWAQADPQKCLDWASGLPTTNADVLKEALIDVSDPGNDNRQPALAAQYVDKLQDASLRNEAIHEIGVNWGAGLSFEGGGEGADPTAALDWLNQVATGDIYDKTVKDIFAGLDYTNPSLAGSMLDKIPEPDVRDTMTTSLVESWRQSDPDAALQWAQSLPDSEQAIRDKAMTQLVGDLARINPVAIASLVENSPNPAQYLSSAPTIAASLATVDPQAALAWVNNLPDGDTKNSALKNALVMMSVSNFSEAWNDAVNLTNASGAIDLIVEKNPTEAAPLIGQLPTEAARVSATTALVMTLAESNPTQATALLGQLPSGDAQNNATRSLAATWAVEDTQGFTTWVNTLPPGSQHDAAVSSAVEAVQNLKLPAAEQAELLQSLNQATGSKPAP
jgi:hypothetical protein